MHQLLIIALVIACALFGRWIWRQPPRVRLRWAAYLAIAVLAALAVTGRLHWLLAAGSAILGFLPIVFRKLMALRWIILSTRRFRNTYHQYKRQTGNEQQPNVGKGHARTNMTREEALEILGLDANASRNEITTAHKRLMQKMHPDRGGSSALAKKINMAKAVLLQ